MAIINKAVIVGLLSSVLLITACTSVEEGDAKSVNQNELAKISVLAVDNNIKIQAGDTFSWHAPMAIEGTSQANVAALLTADIEQGIKQYQHDVIQDENTPSTFKLAAMAVLDKNGEESLSLVTHFGIDPGLGHSHMDHDKGALVLAVTNQDNAMLWRGVVQIFTDEDMDKETRTLRRERAIHLLLKELFSKTVVAETPAAGL